MDSLLQTFRGSCTSLDSDMSPAVCSLGGGLPHQRQLGSGVDIFDEAGQPRTPKMGGLRIHRFGGSYLDLNQSPVPFKQRPSSSRSPIPLPVHSSNNNDARVVSAAGRESLNNSRSMYEQQRDKNEGGEVSGGSRRVDDPLSNTNNNNSEDVNNNNPMVVSHLPLESGEQQHTFGPTPQPRRKLPVGDDPSSVMSSMQLSYGLPEPCPHLEWTVPGGGSNATSQVLGSKKLVLVTGANSFIGSHVVCELIRAGYNVRAREQDFPDERSMSRLIHTVRQIFPETVFRAPSSRVKSFGFNWGVVSPPPPPPPPRVQTETGRSKLPSAHSASFSLSSSATPPPSEAAVATSTVQGEEKARESPFCLDSSSGIPVMNTHQASLTSAVPPAPFPLFFCESASMSDAIAGCSFVVHHNSPPVDTCRTALDVIRLYVEDIQNLFLGLHPNLSKLQQVVIINAAPTSTTTTDTPPSILEWKNESSLAASIVQAKAIALSEAERLAHRSGIVPYFLLPTVMIGPHPGFAAPSNKVAVGFERDGGGAAPHRQFKQLPRSPASTSSTQIDLTHFPEAVKVILDFALRGTRWFPFVPELYWNFVDVRDVARSCVAILELPSSIDQTRKRKGVIPATLRDAKGQQQQRYSGAASRSVGDGLEPHHLHRTEQPTENDGCLVPKLVLNGGELAYADIGNIISRFFPCRFHPPLWHLPNRLTLFFAALGSSSVDGHRGRTLSFLQRKLGQRAPNLDQQTAETLLCLNIQPTSLQTTVCDVISGCLRVNPDDVPPDRETKSRFVRFLSGNSSSFGLTVAAISTIVFVVLRIRRSQEKK